MELEARRRCPARLEVEISTYCRRLVMVSEAVLLTLLYLAVMVACVRELTATVVTLNVALVLPAATVTVAGTTAAL